jgi:hypothetical protein
MSGLPVPSITGIRRGKSYRFWQVARSKPGRSLLFTLISVFALYVVYVNFYDTVHYGNMDPWYELGTTDVAGSEAEEGPTKPLTALGLDADRSFHLGSTSKAKYKAELEQFVTRALPRSLQKRAKASIELYLGDSKRTRALPEMPYKIYQTAKREPYWTETSRSWQNIPGFTYYFFDDTKADKWVRETFNGAEMELVWDRLGPGIKVGRPCRL